MLDAAPDSGTSSITAALSGCGQSPKGSSATSASSASAACSSTVGLVLDGGRDGLGLRRDLGLGLVLWGLLRRLVGGCRLGLGGEDGRLGVGGRRGG